MEELDIDARTWTALNQLLDTALDLPPDKREAWLEELTGEYGPLALRLRELLTQAGQLTVEDPLNTIPKLDIPAFEEKTSPYSVEKPGDTVGPYRLVRELGRGGMGTVWLAERIDGMLDRPAALKLPSGNWQPAVLAERMARERQILATLNHPNIARLYDAGFHDGRPYLALEYVEGCSISDYCESQSLGVTARLSLFLDVIKAVAHAHSRLVVHRDLKPSNILVTGDGQVVLLDFGIAKLLEEGTAQETGLTEFGGRALTPDYASPEQIAGKPIGTASDIYSLAVVLYELLVGTRPYNLRRASRGALEDAILRVEPVRPSVAAPEPVRKILRGDLDTILLKALKKPPEDRYPTAEALADDLQRHLSGQPVLTRADSRTYRLSKFLRRNRLGVAAAMAVLLAVLVGVSTVLWQARVAIAERNRAEEVKAFLVDIFRDANLEEGEGKSLTALDLLKRANERIDNTLTSSPGVRSELRNAVGASLMSLGDTETAEVVTDRAVLEATETLTDNDPELLRARLLRAWVLLYRGKTKEMRLEIDRVMAAMETGQGLTAQDRVFAWRLLCGLSTDEGKHAEAESAGREAVRLADAMLSPYHREKVLALLELAYSYQQAQKPREALAMATRGYQTALAAHSSNLQHPIVIRAGVAYANALGSMGQWESAIEQIEQAIQNATAVFGESSMTVGVYWQNLVDYQLKAGSIKAALESSQTAFDLCDRFFEPDSYTHMAAVKTRALALSAARRMEEALPWYTGHYLAAERILGPEHRLVLESRASHARILAFNGKISEAERAIESITQEVRRLAPSSLYLATRIAGVIQRVAGNYEAALRHQEEALRLIDPDAPKTRLPMTLIELGLDYLELGRYEEAASALEQAGQALAEWDNRTDPDDADVLVGLGRIRLAQRKPAEALPLFEEADEFWREFDPGNRWAGEAALWLGRCYAALGRVRESREPLERARTILSRSPLQADVKLLELAGAG